MPQHSEALTKYYAYCAGIGIPPAQVALAWLQSHPGVTATVVGPRTTAQLDSALATVDIELSTADRGALDEIFPGFRPAPEHYAW